ncbi:MAG: transposase, partial [Lachnospiraceae bacterium]|nr:transposase [Lachnospiraceae bacterium]
MTPHFVYNVSTTLNRITKESLHMDIIQYLLFIIQQQHQMLCWLLNFICRYIPLKQWAFDDSHS